MRLKAGALALVVGISLVIGLLTFGLFFIFRYSEFSIKKNILSIDLINNINSTFEYIQAAPSAFLNESITPVDLYNLGSDSVLVSHSKWGLFDLINVKAIRGSHIKTKRAFIGNLHHDPTALFLSTLGNEVSLIGHSEIIGVSRTPNGTLNYTDAKGRVTTSIHNHQTYVSQTTLPQLKATLIRQLGPPSNSHTGTYAISENIQNSFENSPLHYYNSEKIILTGTMTGKIIIESGRHIEISHTAKLEDVILTAPKITIRDFVTGTFQAIASDTIIVNTGVKLMYPSLLAVVNAPKGYLEINSADISGTLIMVTDDSRTSNYLHINSSKITGIVYNDGFSNVSGEINGSLYSHKLIANIHGEIRENTLQSCRLINNQSVKKVISPFLFNKPQKSALIKWLY